MHVFLSTHILELLFIKLKILLIFYILVVNKLVNILIYQEYQNGFEMQWIWKASVEKFQTILKRF